MKYKGHVWVTLLKNFYLNFSKFTFVCKSMDSIGTIQALKDRSSMEQAYENKTYFWIFTSNNYKFIYKN